MIDIHCHILDNVDDGAFCLSESVEMARIAREGRTDRIIATPHVNIPGEPEIDWGPVFKEKLPALNERLRQERVPVTVYPGHEVFCDGDLLGMLRHGTISTLNGSRYLLIEFDFYERAETILDRCRELLAAGVVPVVAHPERYEAMKEDEQIAYRLKKRGCLLQLNSGSLYGVFGASSQHTAHTFLADSLADFIASDAHSPFVRTPFMADAHEIVSEMYSPEYADLLFDDNPASVLVNREIKGFY